MSQDKARNLPYVSGITKLKRSYDTFLCTRHPSASVILKIDSVEERKSMRDLAQLEFVDASFEVADLLVNRALKN